MHQLFAKYAGIATAFLTLCACEGTADDPEPQPSGGTGGTHAAGGSTGGAGGEGGAGAMSVGGGPGSGAGGVGGAPDPCLDGVLNGDETDVDCGGSCVPCANDESCSLNVDCVSGFCTQESVCSEWAFTQGDMGSDATWGIAFDGDSNMIIGGEVQGAADLGGGAITPSGTTDAFVAKYGPTGAFDWGFNFSGDVARVYDLVVDEAGDVYASGIYIGAGNVGGLTLGCPTTAENAVVFKLDGATGAPQWAQCFGGSDGVDQATGVAVRGGTVAVSVDMGSSTLAIGATSYNRVGAGSDVLVVRINASNGAVLNAASFGSAGGDVEYPADVALTSAGDVVVVGSYGEPFGLSASTASAGHRNGFVALLAAADLTPTWTRSIVSSIGLCVYDSVTTDSSDRSYVGGACTSSSQDPVAIGAPVGDIAGSGIVSSPEATGDPLIVSYASDGTPQWANVSSGERGDGILDVAMAPDGDVVAVGLLRSRTLQLGPQTVTHSNQGDTAAVFDAFAMRLDSGAGTTVAARGFASSELGLEIMRSVAVAPNGNVAAVGLFNGTLTVAGTTHQADINEGFTISMGPLAAP